MRSFEFELNPRRTMRSQKCFQRIENFGWLHHGHQPARNFRSRSCGNDGLGTFTHIASKNPVEITGRTGRATLQSRIAAFAEGRRTAYFFQEVRFRKWQLRVLFEFQCREI